LLTATTGIQQNQSVAATTVFDRQGQTTTTRKMINNQSSNNNIIVDNNNVMEETRDLTTHQPLTNEVYDQKSRLLKHTANAVMMVRPVHFEFNPETAVDNEFQNNTAGQLNSEYVTEAALLEFAKSVEILQNEGIEVIVLEKMINESTECTESSCIKTPDAVFPNNWFGTTRDGKVIVYTMATENRRAETRRLPDVIQMLHERGFEFDEKPLIMSSNNNNCDEGQDNLEILEGTGAMVIDHVGGVVYAAKSVRCNPKALDQFMQLRSHQFSESVLFETKSSTGKEIYHTNVMMSIGSNFAVVCSESIVEHVEGSQSANGCLSRSQVLSKLAQDRTVIDISFEQAERHFCANILELRGHNDEPKIVMSTSAYNGFTPEQRAQLEKCGGKLVPIPIADAIEFVGGGSARCMLAEVFLPKKKTNVPSCA